MERSIYPKLYKFVERDTNKSNNKMICVKHRFNLIKMTRGVKYDCVEIHRLAIHKVEVIDFKNVLILYSRHHGDHILNIFGKQGQY